MAEIPGNATQEEIEKRALRELKGQLVGISTDRMVLIDATTAALITDLLPSDEELEETDEEKEKFSMKAPAPAAAAAAPASAKKLTRSDLDGLTKEELVEKADDLDVEVSPSWVKEDIIKAIIKGQ